jgi:hypothetical protein
VGSKLRLAQQIGRPHVSSAITMPQGDSGGEAAGGEGLRRI